MAELEEQNAALRAGVRRAALAMVASEDALGRMLCAEVHPLIELLLLAGLDEEAVQVVENHAHGDSDGGDVHHHIYLAADDEAQRLAREWLQEIQHGMPLCRYRALTPDGAVFEATSNPLIRALAGRLFEQFIRPIPLERWERLGPLEADTGHWVRYAEVNTMEWWKTTGGREGK